MSTDRAQLERLRDKLALVLDEVPEAGPALASIEDDLRVLDQISDLETTYSEESA